jgi:ABC-type multidrug transport system fused ATPase/permease subunit
MRFLALNALRKKTFVQCLQLFSKQDLRKISLVVLIQIFLGALDLIGVALIGVIGALAVTGIQSSQPGNRVQTILDLLHLTNFSFQSQTTILGLGSAVILIGRTIVSVYFSRKILFFIARRSAFVSRNFIQNLLSQNLLLIQNYSVQQCAYAATSGVTSITLGVVGASVALIADLSLLAVMAIGLFALDALVSTFALLLFGLIGYGLFRFMRKKAEFFGNSEATMNVESNEKLYEALTSYREAFVRGRRDYYVIRIGELRFRLSDALAQMSFMPSVSKYVIETSLIIGAVTLSAFQFMNYDARHAFSTLAVFLAAGSRISPAVLRVQQGLIGIKGSLASADKTLEIMRSFEVGNSNGGKVQDNELKRTDFKAEVRIKNASFRYPNALNDTLKNINIDIKVGSLTAIVGSSGAGKSTLMDLLLGVFTPTRGKVEISGVEPIDAITRWPGCIGYVPQDVYIYPGTVLQNIALGFDDKAINLERATYAIELAQLGKVIEELPLGVDTFLGDRGTRLSGGQRQRLGIARALYTDPSLLILDEATSSLDGQTESDIGDAIQSLQGKVTVIMIAHRLASVRKANSVIYLEEGAVIASGKFEEVRALVPNFDSQASLMGL